jgi:hypothetical protein
MNCGETKGLLSEYVDEVLDEKTKALVDEHLSTCKDCQQEFASLKRLVKELGSLESVQPPKDFLKQLHERIEQRSRFSKILRTLFVPMRVKIPLEFAGAAVMAILIFSVLHFQQEQYKMAEAPVSLKQGRVAEKGVLDSSVKGVKEDTYKPQLAYKTVTAEQPQEKREPMELALVMKEELPSEAYAPGAAIEAAPAAKKKMTRSLVMKEAGPRGQLERDESVDDSVAKLTRLIELVGGKTLSIEYEKESNRPESIHAEIPGKQFSTFYKQLKELGDLQSAPKTVTGKDKEVVPVQVRLLPSR